MGKTDCFASYFQESKNSLGQVRAENEKERKRYEAQERADELREEREERRAEKALDKDDHMSNFYGQPRVDENGLWIKWGRSISAAG